MIRLVLNSEFQNILSWVESLRSPQFNWTTESMRAEFLTGRVFGYFRDDQILAFVCVRETDFNYEWSVLATHPDHRGQGLMGEVLINTLGQMAPLKPVWLEVHEENQSARYLYEKLGFQRTGQRAKYYSDGRAAILYTWERGV